MTSRRRLGDFGERIVLRRLEAEGCRILATNVRVSSGEIDIVAADGDEVAFVEVRTRRAAPGLAAESADDRKLLRMWDCAMRYCERESIDPARARVDLVSVDIDASGRVGDVTHFKAIEIPEPAD